MISVIIPAYNEEKIIGDTIDNIIKIMKSNKIYDNSEIIIVNDGSTDNTKKIVLKKDVILINNPCNMGYGYSLKKGIEHAKNEMIVITDADGTYPFDNIMDFLEKKKEGFDLVVGARTGKYYRESIHKSLLRRILKRFVEYICSKKIKDVNSGLRVFDKTTVMKFFPRLCNTFSFTTSQTLAYNMNALTVAYIDIPYNKRVGKSKVKLIRDSVISMKYILETGIYYNPLKVFFLFSVLCIILSIIGFVISHFLELNVFYILAIGSLLLSIVIICIGFLAVLLKQIMDK